MPPPTTNLLQRQAFLVAYTVRFKGKTPVRSYAMNSWVRIPPARPVMVHPFHIAGGAGRTADGVWPRSGQPGQSVFSPGTLEPFDATPACRAVILSVFRRVFCLHDVQCGYVGLSLTRYQFSTSLPVCASVRGCDLVCAAHTTAHRIIQFPESPSNGQKRQPFHRLPQRRSTRH